MNSSSHYDQKQFILTCSFFIIVTRNFIQRIVKIVSTIGFWFKLSLELFRDNHMMGNLFGIVEGCLDKIF
jgi:hypothetical protein